MGKGIPKFREAHAALLARFLASPRRPKGTMTYPRAAGFLFGIAHGPELIPPSEWTPIIFGDQDANFETREEAEVILEALLALYNDCNRQGTEGSASLPPGCEIRERPLDNLAADAALSQWAQGFISGHTYLDELWHECTPSPLDEGLGALLVILSFFASEKLANSFFEKGEGEESLEDFAETVLASFPEAMTQYAFLGRAIFKARLELYGPRPRSSPHPEVRRNDPCPCGSGKKFKKCCGAT
jgi:uncharacterized protein